MRNTALMLMLLICNTVKAQSIPPGMNGVPAWFSAWNFVCQNKFGSSATIPTIFLYDDSLYYATASLAATDQRFTAPGPSGKLIEWYTGAHNGTLRIPDGQSVPLGLMSFAAADSAGNPFFVMATPRFWKSAGVESRELGLEKLITAVFLHEFAHTRQQRGMGATVTTIEQKHPFHDPPLSDDIVQHLFSKDSVYVGRWKEETDLFYQAAFHPDKRTSKKLTCDALRMLHQRQVSYFTGDREVLRKLDDIFLTMEGLGQFAGLYWLQHPSGGKLPYATAVEGMRRKRNQWSQEEGLAMFLILDKMGWRNWERDVLSDDPKTIVQQLHAACGCQ
ncbi:hypothetical protein ACTJJ0_05550 [Chitinophaga sp. 22321]|uniref:Peptidase MA superfamily protein n=1 Tax=Chitinophaga hostae TaxID=2831022 RepID=A0ABS5IZ79_9BACT|nr:hypothetical protein [Chitinophaga hostae]MBS0028278.1 hypothetical protein [Chitinophaga hostae]